ncbi:MAG: hypothetical protein CSA45_02770 [Gammaproteobacteria bacterium]|nr:MAG: hypothetical protein CSA45_02770 [Gammaproteobacteria bacterium]
MRFILIFNICFFIFFVSCGVIIDSVTGIPTMTSMSHFFTEFTADGWVGYAVFAVIATVIAGGVKLLS